MVTQSLRFQYIWIDSICIIQDDEEDWEVQSSLMGSIYSHAACNIAATWASDGSKGCFGNGDLAAKSPTFLTLRGSLGGSYQVWNNKSYEADVIHAPLNKRGWVIQERYLARQQLSFARRQVYWECRELMASEQFPAGLPESISKHQACLEFENEFEARKAWNHIVELYSNCQLTKKSDKLVAISGLAQALQESIHDDYICGLWRKDLHHQLLWVSEGDNGQVTTTYGQIAPTWSWANIDGPVLFLKDHLLAKSIESMPWMEVLGIPAGPTNRLSLRGIAVRSHIQISDDRNILSHEFRHILDRSIRKSITKVFNLHLSEYNRLYSAPDVVLDSYNDLQRNRDFDLIFFMICRDRGVDQGLVLRKLPPITDGRMQYVRIGVFWTDPAFMDPYWKHVTDRLGLPEPDIYGMDRPLDLGDPRLADLVHTVHIV
ncbi:hypothetical protein PFICI_05755 [Pestalotiopsis fici W106-1]|uniref:Heterokaryon incompatibility domain-containing protein n=1 Tax=Pestalotiopsis fici (strain W106-1 / CGMCC3.15140) TaxID=1229662 RepID=W3XCZ0_PESFW|nr:uncharacterized protein PFICI_05755 [Pestalotiopsis fici W106-1]ETS83879.1 hypothetical protein PFICI_05755 [Pestalotiopsis fici W106-1]